MSESSAISPEVKGLFDTVKKQAESYQKAFEELAYNTKIFRDTVKKANQLIEDLQDEPDRISMSINEKVDGQIRLIEREQQNLRKKYDFISNLTKIIDNQNKRIDDIDQFRKNLEKLEQDLINKKERVEVLFDNTQKEAQITIKKIIEDGNARIKDEIESNSKQVENNIVMRQRQIEGKLISYDEKYYNMNDQFKTDIKRLNNELERISEINEQLQRKINMQKTDSYEDIDAMHIELKHQIKELEIKFNQYTNIYKPNDGSSINYSDSRNSDTEIDDKNINKTVKNLKEKLFETEEKLADTEKKTGLSLTMAWIAMLAVIVMIIVVVVALT